MSKPVRARRAPSPRERTPIASATTTAMSATFTPRAASMSAHALRERIRSIDALRGFVMVVMRLDVTDESGLSRWLTELGLPRVDGVTSMARGPLPQRPPHCGVYALASQSLG
ncbi:MAG: hypothetical protein R3E65_04125 [Steroidobacteraceae bacterium]